MIIIRNHYKSHITWMWNVYTIKYYMCCMHINNNLKLKFTDKTEMFICVYIKGVYSEFIFCIAENPVHLC